MMANPEHVEIVHQGADAKERSGQSLDLKEANLQGGNLQGAYLDGTVLPSDYGAEEGIIEHK